MLQYEWKDWKIYYHGVAFMNIQDMTTNGLKAFKPISQCVQMSTGKPLINYQSWELDVILTLSGFKCDNEYTRTITHTGKREGIIRNAKH